MPSEVWSTRVFDESQTAVIADSKRLVCNCTGDKRNEYARLIAAAPDLLKALKAITEAMATKGYQEWWSGRDGCRQKSELAIAKAEGKS